jgi:hypothetical protein
MTTETTGAPAVAAEPISTASNALFGDPTPVVVTSDPAAGVVVEPVVELTPEELAAKAAADALKAAEEPVIKRPGKDATPEDWAAFYKSIGAPDTADAYEVALPDGDAAENAPIIKEMFKEAGILPEQAAKLLDFRNRVFAQQNAAAAAAETARVAEVMRKGEAEHTELKNEWGAASTANHEIARRGMAQFIEGGPEQHAKVIAALESSIGTKAALKFFHGIGKGLSEHDAAGLGSANGQAASTKTTAQVLYPTTSGK